MYQAERAGLSEGPGLTMVELDDYRWLVSDAARPYLDRAAQHPGSSPALAQLLRRELSTARTHLVLQQVERRRRAAVKFSHASSWFFTPQLLEQATGERVARYKAGRFPPQQPVVDLCCGIGGDSTALAARGPVTSVDCDSVALLLAEANSRQAARELASPFPHAFCLSTAETYRLESGVLWHLDPDRRATGSRTTQLEHFQPGLLFLEKLRQADSDGVMKLAPATSLPPSWSSEGGREWVGTGRECREQLYWCGRLATAPGLRQATVLASSGEASSIQGRGDESLPEAIERPAYLVEPHAVVRAAGLVGALAQFLHLQPLDSHWSLLASHHLPSPHPLISRFTVLHDLPFDWKACKAILRREQFGQLEVKPKGLDWDPAAIAQKLRVPGDQQATLFALRSADKSRMIVTVRI